MLKIGSHISFKAPNYLVDSINESLENNANTVMIYLGPPQSSKRIDPSKYKVDEYKKELINKISPIDIIVHAPYIINLANLEKSEFAKKFLISEINRMNVIGAKYIVLHPGASLKQDINESLEHLAKNLKEILNETKDVEIVLETMAGKSSEIGASLEQLKYLIDKVNDDRIGICLDTCHMWDAGYDLKNDFESNNGKMLFDKLDKLSLTKKVKVIHLNDSKNELNSHKDRHENIGKGHIGKKALINFANHKNFDNIPIILETPYTDGKNLYAEEIKMIREGRD
ncbi:MAG: deoxyribonuclease IV [Mycoplasma sp.]|nr:deoxyribonuclease IV [Mycoplasma sp.]